MIVVLVVFLTIFGSFSLICVLIYLAFRLQHAHCMYTDNEESSICKKFWYDTAYEKLNANKDINDWKREHRKWRFVLYTVILLLFLSTKYYYLLNLFK